ncbi:MAG: hypothetical protein IKO88_03130 [Bacteroidales bacterium]|nr:hypothetical protein [Bacteroidales bacterium]MBR4478973.1 hypothetical protein [Bacteroidales bacterium]
MRFIKYLIVTLVAVLAFQPLHADGENYKEQLRKQPKTLHYTDTIRSANKQQQFLRAIELAPSVFVYKEIVWKDASTVTVKGMRFNPSMDNTLKCEIVEKDPGLGKRLKRLNTVTRPLNGVVDLTVSYHRVPSGIAVDYLIQNISIFGIGRSSEKKKK